MSIFVCKDIHNSRKRLYDSRNKLFKRMVIANVPWAFSLKRFERGVVRFDWESAGERFEYDFIQTSGLARMHQICGFPIFIAQLRLGKTAKKLHAGAKLVGERLKVFAFRSLSHYPEFAVIAHGSANGNIVPLALHKSPDREYPIAASNAFIRRKEFCVDAVPHDANFRAFEAKALF